MNAPTKNRIHAEIQLAILNRELAECEAKLGYFEAIKSVFNLSEDHDYISGMIAACENGRFESDWIVEEEDDENDWPDTNKFRDDESPP